MIKIEQVKILTNNGVNKSLNDKQVSIIFSELKKVVELLLS